MDMCPANGPTKAQSNGGLAEIISSESASLPSKPPSVTPDVQKCHRTEKPTLKDETPTSRKKQGTTVAHQYSPAEESSIPSCEHEQHLPYPTETSQKDPRLGNESFESVNSEIDFSPFEPSHASPDDDCAIADLKNENHRIPPPREEPIKDDPMTNQIPIPTEKIYVPPKLPSIPMPAEFDSAQKPFRPPPGFHSTPKPILASTGAYPVFKPSRIHAGASSVVEPPEKPCIMVDPQFDPQLIYSCGHFHANPRLKKPPDEQPLRCRPSESIPECVSRTHPSRNPKEDAQYNHHLQTGPVCRPMPATMSHVYQETPKLATPPEDTVIRMPDAAPHTTASTSSPWQQLREGSKLLS
nr:zonadhesin-like [Aedes albopictus]